MAIKLSAASPFRGPLPPPRSGASIGTVTLIEKCSGAVGFEAVATDHRWVVHISGGSVGRGDLTPSPHHAIRQQAAIVSGLAQRNVRLGLKLLLPQNGQTMVDLELDQGLAVITIN